MEGAKEPVTLKFRQYEVEFEMSYEKWKELERMFQSPGFMIYGKDVRASAHIEVIVIVPAESKKWIFYVEKTFVENLSYLLLGDFNIPNYHERRKLVDKFLNEL